MRKYYTRACNFHYGDYAKKLIRDKKGLPLAGNKNIAFDSVEIFERKKKNKVKISLHSLQEIKNLNKKKKICYYW